MELDAVAELVNLITRRVKTYQQKLTNYIKQNSLFNKGDGIVVALSGGSDSVFLLLILNLIKAKWDLRIVAAHFDHSLRGKESDRDAKFSKDLCEKLKIEFFSEKGDVKGYSRTRKLSIQEAARHLRYRFLHLILKKTNCDYIATAHTADDQAEEILLRLIRGTGIAGISGIKSKNKKIIRPVLNFSKLEILSFLKENNISFCVDSSNLKDKYLRNKIRLKLIPFLKKNFNPNILNTLNKTANNFYYEYVFISRYIKYALKKSIISIEKNEKIILSASNLLREPINIRTGIYKSALKKSHLYSANIASKHFLAVDNLLLTKNASSYICLPDNVTAKKGYDNLIFERHRSVNKEHMDEIIIYAPGTYQLPDANFLEIKEDIGFATEEKNQKNTKKLWISSKKIAFPLFLRCRKPGDRFMPLGLNNEIKLKNFFINKKITMSKRNSLCVLTNSQDILAITGIEISEKFKVKNNNDPSYRISII